VESKQEPGFEIGEGAAAGAGVAGVVGQVPVGRISKEVKPPSNSSPVDAGPVHPMHIWVPP